MPTYDYRCSKCGHQFEYLQSITENPLQDCPRCRGPLKRLIGGGAGLIFKGSGFYVTDYRNNPSVSKSNSKPVRKKGVTKDSGKKEAESKTGGGGKDKQETKNGKGE